MSKGPFVVFGLFAALCLLVLPWWALGKEGSESAAIVEVADRDAAGKELFATNCGACHTLAAAGTDGVVAPNLDELLAPTGSNPAEQFEGLTSRVLTAITCGIPSGGGRMPQAILLGDEAIEAAQFVAAYAGQIDKGPTVDTSAAQADAPEDCPPASG
ncbi:MAG: c-type cytochrome [Solirubrobacterales bacterium]